MTSQCYSIMINDVSLLPKIEIAVQADEPGGALASAAGWCVEQPEQQLHRQPAAQHNQRLKNKNKCFFFIKVSLWAVLRSRGQPETGHFGQSRFKDPASA